MARLGGPLHHGQGANLRRSYHTTYSHLNEVRTLGLTCSADALGHTAIPLHSFGAVP